MADNNLDMIQALSYIPASSLSYTEWIGVGMGLKESGYPVSVWDDWSRSDSRYHQGECARKWNSFRGSDKPITAATIIQMAKQNGYKPTLPGRSIDWDDWLDEDAPSVVDQNWLDTAQDYIAEPDAWDPYQQVRTYLATLFKPEEYVGLSMRAWKGDDGKWHPDGCICRTAGELITALDKHRNDIGYAIGDANKEAGAWVCFNPLDGKGRKAENVTAFRYALVESDNDDPAQQQAIIRELQLPVAALIHSGGKSIHAIVKINAPDEKEYRKRVDYLYKVCEKNGLKVDVQNRNANRLSRLPGVMRNGKKQFLIDTNIGKSSWEEWREFIESAADDFPEFVNLASCWGHLPPLTPPLIDGILRRRHKMLIAGPSKAGKSYALIELCVSLAEGKPWLGFNCAQGKVLYVNLELDAASCFHRFEQVYAANGWPANNVNNIVIWNLRGWASPMNKLAGPLISRAKKNDFVAVIIDPIYKVLTGDENSADEMAEFCNFFDKICVEANCSVIYCHHHSKGSQGWKRSMDRASGSGVFARDPDALLDMLELQVPDDYTEKETERRICIVCRQYLQRAGLLNRVLPNCLESSVSMRKYCQDLLPGSMQEIQRDIDNVVRQVATTTAYRIEGTLREFPPFPPVSVWFDHPVHRLDTDGILADAKPVGFDAPNKFNNSANLKKRKTGDDRVEEIKDKVRMNFDFLVEDGKNSVPLGELAKACGYKTERTLASHIEEHMKDEFNLTGKTSASRVCRI